MSPLTPLGKAVARFLAPAQEPPSCQKLQTDPICTPNVLFKIDAMTNTSQLLELAAALGARDVLTLSRTEEALLTAPAHVTAELVESVKDRISSGDDPLGEI